MTHTGKSIYHLRTNYQGNYANFFIVCHYCFLLLSSFIIYLYRVIMIATEYIYTIISVYPLSSIPACDVITVRRLRVFAAVRGSHFVSPMRSRSVIKINCTSALSALYTFGFDLPSGVELCLSSMCCYYRRENKKFIRVVYDIACFCPSLWQN